MYNTTQGGFYMYGKLALLICDRLIKNNAIPESKRAVYKYGFEVIISSFIYLLIFLFVSILFQCFVPSIFFWLGIFLIRKIAGGHHAKSYLSCHLLYESNHIIFVILFHIVSFSLYPCIILFSLGFAFLSILLLAPIDHKNKPFIKTEYRRFRLLCLLYCVVLAIIFTLYLLRIIPNHSFIFSYAIGTLSATISLLCGKIINYRERKRT